MDYFSKFLRQGTQLVPQKPVDHALEFHRSWQLVRVRSITPTGVLPCQLNPRVAHPRAPR